MPRHVTPSIAGDLLSRYGLRAGIRHGQHFLVDPNTVRRIVRLADVARDECILEIGPGLGSLTVALSEAARRVVAVEIDRQVVDALREVTDGAANVDIVLADAMEADLAAVAGEPCRLIANLPYNVATPIMMRVLSEAPAITGGLVMVQRELGERWTGRPSTRAYNAVSLRFAYHADARIIGDVPATVFMPPPKVESVLVSFTRRSTPPVDVSDERSFFSFVQSAFSHRRKTLRNSLIAASFDKDVVADAIVACGIADRARPEDLSLDDYARLHRAL